MYRLLIVDNEPNIVKGMQQLFLEEAAFELDIYGAYSADEALAMLHRMKIDIVLTDIRMPGMNGLELQSRIVRQWPRCKVIFLTGFDDFSYIQTALRHGGLDYILKTDGEETIVQAVHSAIASLSHDSEIDRHLERANNQMQQMLPALQRDYAGQLVHGQIPVRQEHLDELQIPLDSATPFLLIIARVDRWHEHETASNKALLHYAIQNIAEEYWTGCHCFHSTVERMLMITLIQPKSAENWKEHPDRWVKFVQGQLDAIQASCRKYLRLPVSFAASGSLVQWPDIPVKFAELRKILFHGLGQSEEMLLTDEVSLNFDDASATDEIELKARNKAKQLILSDMVLENRLMTDFEELVEISRGMKHNSPILHEIYNGISYMLLSYMNERRKWDELSALVDVNKLFSLDAHESWGCAVAYLRSLIRLLLDDRDHDRDAGAHFLVTKLKKYIDHHLDEELSLVRLAEIVYLNPTYLSRLFKQHSGQGISDYITQMRLIKSQELLRHSKLKIQEIANKVGFESAAYFGRFFKKKMNLTPQEYRDNI